MSDSRERMIESAARLYSSRGVQGTSFADVIAASGAPRGSIYHHFPQGKQQLTREVARTSGEAVLAYQRACSATDAAGVVQHVVAWWRRIVVESGASTTCPLAAIVIGTVDDQQTLGVVRAAYDEWVDLVAGQLVAVGLGADRAARLARTLLAASQGALLQTKASGSLEPFDQVAAELEALVAP